MAKFKNLITTNQGREMINDSIVTSNSITFTKVSSSAKIYNDSEIPELTSLNNIKQTVNITRTSKVDDTTILIEATIENTNLEEAYTIGSLGLYAKYNNTEKLFAVVSAESIDKGSYMPVYNNQVPTSMYIRLLITIDCVDNITYNIDPTGYATLSDIERLEEEIQQTIGLDVKVITSLPTTGSKGVIYLLSNGGTSPNVYDEYIWVSDTSSYEKIGTTEIDISSKEDKANKVTTISSTSTNIEYPSAKAVYNYVNDILGDIETLLGGI